MKAIVQDKYGIADGLELREVETPVIDDDEILIEVRASSVNAADWHMTSGGPFLVRLSGGLFKPKMVTPGLDVAGRVEAVGENVTRFKAGDSVFGELPGGAYAEYTRASEQHVVPIPAGVTFEQAGAVPVAGLTALQGLRDHGQLQAGQSVLINGASGGVGTYAVQISKFLGAEVTAVCSTRNVDQAWSIGADHVIDYTQDQFADSGRRYDLILDIEGRGPVAHCKRVLNPKGTYVVVGGPKGYWLGPLPRLVRAKLAFMRRGKAMTFFLAKSNHDDLNLLGELLASGQVKSVIEGQRPLGEVPEALAYLGEGHSKGKTVITA